jgi:uncharacterized protein YdaU (DUF1376 family)
MTDSPAMMLWTDAYLGDTKHLTTTEHGAYLLILMAMWRAGGKLPNDERRLATTAGLRIDHWRRMASTIMAFMTIEGEFITQKRLRTESEIVRVQLQKSRTAGALGGRAKALKKQQQGLANASAKLEPQPSNPPSKKLASSEPDIDKVETSVSPLSNYRDADASLVNEAVDGGRIVLEKPKKDTEALRVFGEQWNALAAAFKLPSIDEIKTGSTRERHALARLREMGPDGVQALMTRIRGSPYLRGEVNGFRVTFDWIVNPSNYQKIMEGNYENRKIASFRK